MPIPDYQTMMLPLLKYHADGKEHSIKDVKAYLAEYFGLSEHEKQELLSSGKTPVFTSRVGWAKTYLKKAGLLEVIKTGVHKITNNGIDLLKSNPVTINNSLLRQYPEFREFVGKPDLNGETINTAISDEFVSPEELLENSYNTIRKSLAQEVLQKVKSSSPLFFETLVVELLVKMGYGGSIKDAGKAIGKSGDEGIDGIIKEDRLGLDLIYIQAKRWEGKCWTSGDSKIGRCIGGTGSEKGDFYYNGKVYC